MIALIDSPGEKTWPQPSRPPGRTEVLHSRGGQQALPLVKMIVSDIVPQDRIVEDLQQRLSTLTKERSAPVERLVC